MDRISVPDAIEQVHKKDREIQKACLPLDAAMLRIRREYMLSMDHSQWPASVASRLELTNKDHRAGLRMSLHNLHDKLRRLYETGSSERGASGRANVSGPVEHADDRFDLMAYVQAKHAGAANLCQRLEGLMEEVESVNDQYGKNPASPVKDRVHLLRAMRRFRKQFDEAMEKKNTIQEQTAEWMPYFVILTSKSALDQLIAADHSMKISKKVFLARATPHCERLARLFSAREDLIGDSSRLAFRLETAWLASGSLTLPTYRVQRELQKFEAYLARAGEYVADHEAVEKALEELSTFAASPNVVTGVDGGEVDLGRLRQAYVPFRQFIALLDSTINLCNPLVEEITATILAFSRGIAN